MAQYITCPWCGTNYDQFQSNCDRCGGPLPPPEEQTRILRVIEAPDDSVPEPPPAPREISNGYAWRLLLADGWGVASLVFLLMGIIFFPLGLILTVGIITAFVGIPFALLGLLFLGGGGALGYSRYQEKMKTVEVLRNGAPAKGQILSTEMNYNVQVNGRNPWTIKYAFTLASEEYEGKVTTLNVPGPGLQPGRKTSVLYLKDAPEHNVIYPHP